MGFKPPKSQKNAFAFSLLFWALLFLVYIAVARVFRELAERGLSSEPESVPTPQYPGFPLRGNIGDSRFLDIAIIPKCVVCIISFPIHTILNASSWAVSTIAFWTRASIARIRITIVSAAKSRGLHLRSHLILALLAAIFWKIRVVSMTKGKEKSIPDWLPDSPDAIDAFCRTLGIFVEFPPV